MILPFESRSQAVQRVEMDRAWLDSCGWWNWWGLRWGLRRGGCEVRYAMLRPESLLWPAARMTD